MRLGRSTGYNGKASELASPVHGRTGIGHHLVQWAMYQFGARPGLQTFTIKPKDIPRLDTHDTSNAKAMSHWGSTTTITNDHGGFTYDKGSHGDP